MALRMSKEAVTMGDASTGQALSPFGDIKDRV